MSSISQRPMTAADIELGMRLKELAGWNQTVEDWRTFLKLRPGGAFVGLVDGRAAGTVTTVEYEGRMGWIGMVLVDPEFRRRGLGTRLLEVALESLAACETVKLDATPEGREVYKQLGFREERRLSRQVRRQNTSRACPRVQAAVRALKRHDLGSVARFDAAAFGCDRTVVLEAWYERAPQYGLHAAGRDRLAGYCLGRPGSRYEQLGPLVADGLDTAKALLLEALAAAGDRAVVVDSFLHDAMWLDFLRDLGFREERQLIRMYRGRNSLSGRPALQWTVSGPELG